MIPKDKLSRFLIKTSDVGQTFNLLNGKITTKLFILDGMVGRRFGEFVLTKRLGSTIHIKKVRKGKKKK